MAPAALAALGAALVVLGFFLPWVHGTAEFAARDFSGFDLARLVRNFEIVASSSTESGRDKLTAVVLYAVPALAVNGAVLAILPVIRRKAAEIALGAGAVYTLFILAVVSALSLITGTDLERVLGAPGLGLFVSLAGASALIASAVLTTALPRLRRM